MDSHVPKSILYILILILTCACQGVRTDMDFHVPRSTDIRVFIIALALYGFPLKPILNPLAAEFFFNLLALKEYFHSWNHV